MPKRRIRILLLAASLLALGGILAWASGRAERVDRFESVDRPARIFPDCDGAVIPPNAPFAAVMGDQRHGTNLEAPESLIRQIVREEAGGMGGNITITFGGTMGELVRQLKPHIERENSRVGNTMLAQAVRVS